MLSQSEETFSFAKGLNLLYLGSRGSQKLTREITPSYIQYIIIRKDYKTKKHYLYKSTMMIECFLNRQDV